MSYIGNSSTTQTYNQALSYFNGNGVTTAFTLPYPVASAAQLIVAVNNVIQNPSSAFTVSGSTLTFTSAPSSGTSNIWVEYASPVTQVVAPSAGSVNQAQLGTLTNLPLASGTLGGGDASLMKNRIINGAMVIDQRNAGASVTPINGQYVTDRWKFLLTQASKLTAQQSSTAPTGFNNSLLVTSSSAYSIASGDAFVLQQFIEGFNFADLGWGTASAKTVTLSFQVYSSLTGTFGGSIVNNAIDRSYPFSYTVSAANTWTTVSITIAGDTSGTWVGATNGIGARLSFGLGVGSTLASTAGSWAAGYYLSATGATSVVGTNLATFYITGVQLEVGSSATGFEYRQYQTSLANCQRYAYVVTSRAMGEMADASYFYHGVLTFPVTMRTTPTMSNASYAVSSGNVGTPTLLAVTGATSSKDAAALYNSAANWSATAACAISATFSAEL